MITDILDDFSLADRQLCFIFATPESYPGRE
jgi:hypothetical protein